MKNLCWIILLVGSSCTPTLRVHYDHDRDFDVRQYQTYQWAPQTNIEGHNNPLFYNELNDKRIKKTVDDQLKVKGFTLSNEFPEVILHYHIIVDDKASVVPEPYGIYGPYWTRQGSQIYQYQEGTLIIDVMDAKTNSLAWRGWVVSVIEDDGQMSERLLINAIVKIFEQFPGNYGSDNNEQIKPSKSEMR